ncbi:NDR1/HIN1-like protein 13 [Solanum lycopersicum]|uniref:Late embryogenesis abundant protein LEA-2 subgroup domain-containing protein n=1 Tax=Solanum lycopersicum TaxID=4081 RepID=A0A3Q7G627_SOLLC|nr:NDR1/HIN1-like protein 13 [Solanum lycopersicum]
MEERSPPAAGGKARNLLSSATSLRLSLTPARSTDHTYVVQIPRDQVYRVPPPENAKIVENHRQPETQKKRKCTCCCWIFSALLLTGIAIGIIVLIVNAMYTPKSPEFSIMNVHFKNVTQPQNNKSHTQQFEIDLKIVNINERMDTSFGKGDHGIATLNFNNHEIGHGKYTAISQKPKDSTNSQFNLDAGKLPADFQKTLNDDKKAIPMTLTVKAPMEITSWTKTLKKDVTVTCDFDVQSVKGKSMIKSEDCKTDF